MSPTTWTQIGAVAAVLIVVPTFLMVRYARRASAPHVPSPNVVVTVTNGIAMPQGWMLACMAVANTGDAPTTITGWGYELGGKSGPSLYVPDQGYLGCPDTPYRLDSHDEVAFRGRLLPLLRAVVEHTKGPALDLIPYVDVPTGRVRGEPWRPHEDWWEHARQGHMDQ